LEDLYDDSPPEERKWMHENIDMWKEKPLYGWYRDLQFRL